jgi:NADH:ubiquinone oxidoreductase subunit F (NADH-binding)
MVAARAAQSSDVVIYLHRSRRDSIAAIERALSERPRTSVAVRVVDVPARYVAGESSAVVSYLDGLGALPRRRREPAAVAGVAGRPTVINNVETIAHLGLIARYGPDWFKQVGGADSPGSSLVTLAGEVTVPGVVAELVGEVSIGELLGTIGGRDVAPRAVLLGGYEGIWLDGEAAWDAVLTRDALFRARMSLGCGVIALLGESSCGLATTARLVRWLAGESAGQCGPCVFGLPAIADLMEAIVAGVASRRDLRRLEQLCVAVDGRGACGHPTGVVALVESALATFEHELRDHLRGRACEPAQRGFPLRMQASRSS